VGQDFILRADFQSALAPLGNAKPPPQR